MEYLKFTLVRRTVTSWTQNAFVLTILSGQGCKFEPNTVCILDCITVYNIKQSSALQSGLNFGANQDRRIRWNSKGRRESQKGQGKITSGCKIRARRSRWRLWRRSIALFGPGAGCRTFSPIAPTTSGATYAYLLPHIIGTIQDSLS